MRSLWRVGFALCGLWLLLSSSVSAYVLTGQDWTYQANPMGEDFRVCPTGVPGDGVQRTKDGAFEWNYPNFNFTFGSDSCLSGGTYPNGNDVNQVDIGGGLGSGTLAAATWFYNSSTGDILECDIRFNNTFNWYTGTGAPASNQYDWWSVAAHEMGHCLGLGHESGITTPKPVMYPSLANGEVRRDPTADDIAGRNTIYGGDVAGDLIISSLSAPTSSGAGLTITVNDSTKNQGTGSADPSTTKFYLSTNNTLDTSVDELICSRSVPSLAPAAISPGSSSCTIPTGTATGDYYIISKADGDDALTETNEGNNTKSKFIKIGPDLIISSLSAPSSATAGSTIFVKDTTKNQGGGTAGASTTKFYLSKNNKLGSGDEVLGSRNVPSLAPGKSNPGTTSVMIPAGTAPGTYYIIARGDDNNAVSELNETNNIKKKTITIN